jgi:hypothetical protein
MMLTSRKRKRRTLIALIAGTVLASPAHAQVTCDCVYELPPPAGTYVNSWFGRQLEKAQTDR